MSDCKAVLNIKGEQFCCDQQAPHTGWAHGNREAEAIWCSHGEAVSQQKRAASHRVEAVVNDSE